MALLNDGSVVIFDSTRLLRRYNIQTGLEITSAGVKDASGMAEVKIGDKVALAVSDSR